MKAFASQDFLTAKDKFQSAIESFQKANSQSTSTVKCSIDPETLIFINNADANIKGNPLTIALVLPYDGKPESNNISEEFLRGTAHAQNQFIKAIYLCSV
ncbi:hypothetical protein CEN50_18490 [Fischerella thermalis CCMEE 5268]|uniref:Uncharacterized protein n=1 Tax=Fischerella thermalis CCMEE 5268 TaxID=2019662 RepID=A0A2N6KCN8_9CYAN|nr:hypothetical protein [Fischerella thermalis]PLZ96484.1 hypothetical protein CEN50_18490 [Fischerella thermalis CCMEE 5268]